MSADSQATGTNYVVLPTLTNTGQIALATYWKLNGFSKRVNGFDTPISLDNAGSAGSRKIVCLQQDWSGSGTANLIQAAAYNENNGLDVSSSSLFTTTNVWRWIFIYVNGTAFTVWYGTETGSLSSYSATLPTGVTASDFSSGRLGSDIFGAVGVGELSWSSFRGVRAWVNTTFTLQEVTAERDSTTFAPVKSSGLICSLPMATGTNPEVADIGSNGTLTGTFTSDASNPNIPIASTNDAIFFGANF